MIDEKKLIEILKERENLLHPHAFQHGTENGHIINDEQAFGRYSEIGIIRQTVKRLAEECNQKQIIQLAMMYAQNMVDYGIDVTQKWETATSQSAALNEAHMRGRQVERDKFAKWQEEHKGGWIPCSERLPEAKKEVLIFADDNAMFVGRLMNGGFSVHDGDGWIDLKFILAWQPLPAPYKEPAAGPAMTNADRIRNMTDEELAKFIHAVGCCRNFGGIPCGYPFCHSMEGNLCHGIKDSTDARTLKWLKSEVVKE